MAKVAGSLLVCFLLGSAPLSFSQLNGNDRSAFSDGRPVREVVFSDLRLPYLATTAATSTSVAGTGANTFAMFAPDPIAPSSSSARLKMQPSIPEQPAPRVFDGKFKVLAALSIATTTADLESTLHCSPTCREINPLNGSHPTRARLYGINAPLLVGELMMSRVLRKRSPDRKLWTIPLVTTSAEHMFGVASNLRAR